VQATLLRLTVTAALQSIQLYAPQTEVLIVCGGGVNNMALLNSLREQAQTMFKHVLKSAAAKPMELIRSWLRPWPLHGSHGRTKQNGQQICRPLRVQVGLES
jgi:hypothetical protein